MKFRVLINEIQTEKKDEIEEVWASYSEEGNPGGSNMDGDDFAQEKERLKKVSVCGGYMGSYCTCLSLGGK